MAKTRSQTLDQSVQSAQAWIDRVAEQFATDDRDFALRVTKAYLHALRDQLPVADAAHFAAQLPDLLRGVFYEGWSPTRVPVHMTLEELVRRFATEAIIGENEVPKVAWAVAAALDASMTNLDKAVERLRRDIRALLQPA